MDIKNELILASEHYTSDIRLRSGISLIPYIGTYLDHIFTAKASKYFNDRIEIFINCVTEEFESIDEDKIDKQYLESEEFFDLITALIENSVKTRHIERVMLYSKLLKSKVSKNISKQYEADDFTYIISELIPRDIFLISEIELIRKEFIEQKENSSNPEKIFDFITLKCFHNRTKFSESEIVFSLSKLAKLGMLNEYYAGNVLGMTPGGDYKTTDTFEQIITILNS
jgi:hypothetical protein